MMFHLLGLALIASSILADSPLYIDELEELVRGPDKRILDRLDDDEWTLRSELKVQVDEILARQSPEIQHAFARIVKMKEHMRSRKNARDQSRAEAADVGYLFEKVKELQTDMTINEHKAKTRMRQLWCNMGIESPEDCYGRSDERDSSEERYYSRAERRPYHYLPTRPPLSSDNTVDTTVIPQEI